MAQLDPPGAVLPMRHAADELAEAIVRGIRQYFIKHPPGPKARLAALYPEGHPYRYMTIGKHEDLEHASVDDVKKFFKTWYVPANATLAIVGDFEDAVDHLRRAIQIEPQNARMRQSLEELLAKQGMDAHREEQRRKKAATAP